MSGVRDPTLTSTMASADGNGAPSLPPKPRSSQSSGGRTRSGPLSRFLSRRNFSHHDYHRTIPNEQKKSSEPEPPVEVHREEVKPVVTPGISFSEARDEVSQMPWYLGSVTGDEAAGILQEMPDHSFLVRDSSDPRSLFAITYRTTRGAVGSTRIQYRAGKFSLSFGNENMPSFRSVVELVQYCIDRSRAGHPVFLVKIGRTQHYVFLKHPLTRYEPCQLQEICRRTVHKHFPRELIEHPDTVLPSRMRSFLLSCPFRPPEGTRIGPCMEPVETSL